ncbi:MAG: hypothetical protein V7746_21650 [Halioglobus sp.]
MNINTISDIILDETSSLEELREALDAFVLLCSDVTNIRPDPSFDAWAEDSLLDNGVAINPQAAAHCAVDYERSVVFIRGIYAAINSLSLRFPETPLEILYAGCGPFATLLLPLLGKFSPGKLKLNLLDFHQTSLDSVKLLLTHFGFCDHSIHTIKADACNYQHTGRLHLVIAETMQKSLEQEPQFAVTANLAPQLWPAGIFIPQRIDVALCLADLEHERELFRQSRLSNRIDWEKEAKRYPLATVCTLSPERAYEQMQLAHSNSDNTELLLESTIVEIPMMANIAQFDAVLFTRIRVFEQYRLKDYQSQITLPLKCHELLPLTGGERYRVSYQLGSYPKFNFERLNKK